MTRFLLLSEDGSSTGLALRLQAEGHSVKTWMRDPLFKNVGKGLIDHADTYEFGQIIVPECIGFGPLLDIYRDNGVRSFAGSLFADHLEEDRSLAEGLMHSCDIATPQSRRVTSWSEARSVAEEFASKNEEGKVVVKPEGKLSGIVPSYVASSPEDVHSMLKSYEHQTSTTEPELIIQEFIKGVVVSTEGWFNGEEWVEGLFNHTLENKKILNDDLGPSEGCAGNVVWACGVDDPIVKQTLTKLTKALREARYVGPFDINCVVNEEGLYALEFTPRFGYDAFPTLLYTLCRFDFGLFMDSCSSNASCSEVLEGGFGAGVRLTLPSSDEHQGAVQIKGFDKKDLQWFYPYHICSDKKRGLESVKEGSLLGVVNGHGDSIGEAFARAYLLCSKAQIRDVQFRSDLAESCLRDYRELERILFEDGKEQPWIGVDLDGTLAKYSGWSDEIGEPIPKMISRVHAWLWSGREVRILTARGSQEPGRYEQLVKVYEWVKEHIGVPLEVTSRKDPLMKKLYDDRVQRVEANTGEFV